MWMSIANRWKEIRRLISWTGFWKRNLKSTTAQKYWAFRIVIKCSMSACLRDNWTDWHLTKGAVDSCARTSSIKMNIIFQQWLHRKMGGHSMEAIRKHIRDFTKTKATCFHISRDNTRTISYHQNRHLRPLSKSKFTSYILTHSLSLIKLTKRPK